MWQLGTWPHVKTRECHMMVGASAIHPSSPGAHVTVSPGDNFSTLSCLVTKSPPIGDSTDSLCRPQFSGFPRCQGHHLSTASENPKKCERLSLTLTGPSSSRVQSVLPPCQGLGTVETFNRGERKMPNGSMVKDHSGLSQALCRDSHKAPEMVK